MLHVIFRFVGANDTSDALLETSVNGRRQSIGARTDGGDLSRKTDGGSGGGVYGRGTRA